MPDDLKRPQSRMVQSPTVMNQLKKLEKESFKGKRNKRGSTNEIQPMETEEGLTQ